ncbi:MAG: hypothetical protein ACYCQJ_05185 [Nitrososphaerales archaeon]
MSRGLSRFQLKILRALVEAPKHCIGRQELSAMVSTGLERQASTEAVLARSLGILERRGLVTKDRKSVCLLPKATPVLKELFARAPLISS